MERLIARLPRRMRRVYTLLYAQDLSPREAPPSSGWLSGLIERPEVLNDVRQHRLVHLIRHGAWVAPPKEDTEQLDLIDN